jgi:hypothetical protein
MTSRLIYRVILLLIVILFLINFTKAKKLASKELFDNWGISNQGIGGITESGSPGTIMCAKSCCYSGWPASIDIDDSAWGIKPGDMGTKYRATNLKCNNGFTTGCVCDAI